MEFSKEGLIAYRLERAEEALAEARILSDKGFWNTTANRLYYACFYSISAFLLTKDIEAYTHSGVKTLFNKELVLSGALSKDQGLLYNKLFGLRQDADYRDFRNLLMEEVAPLVFKQKIF